MFTRTENKESEMRNVLNYNINERMESDRTRLHVANIALFIAQILDSYEVIFTLFDLVNKALDNYLLLYPVLEKIFVTHKTSWYYVCVVVWDE